MFLINSRSGLVSSTGMGLRSKSFTLTGAPSPEVTVPFCLVPSPEFSQAPWYSLPDHLCRFRVRLVMINVYGTFPGSLASCSSSTVVNSSQISSFSMPFLRTCRNYLLPLTFPTVSSISLLRPSSQSFPSFGILTESPSATLFSLALGTDSLCPD